MSLRFGLKEETIEKINTVFSGFPAIEEAVIYGSRAKGNYKPGSDIDVTLKGDQLNYDLLTGIILQLDDLLLPYTFDVSLFSHIADTDLPGHIRRVGKVFYSSAATRPNKERDGGSFYLTKDG